MTCLRYFFICISFILLNGLNVAEAQSNFSELIDRLSQEKSKVESYRLIINQIPEEGSAARYENCTWIDEFSNVGHHNVVANVQRDAKGKAIYWSIGGRSDDIRIGGGIDGGTISATKFEGSSVRTPRKLDWRIVGLGFCGDIGDSFETVGKNIASWDKVAGHAGTFTNTKSRVVVIAEGVSLEAEIADGMRITRFTKSDSTANKKGPNFSEWRVEYKRQLGQMLPASASLQCGDSKLNYEFVWESVNDPLKLGVATLERFQQALKKVNVESTLK